MARVGTSWRWWAVCPALGLALAAAGGASSAFAQEHGEEPHSEAEATGHEEHGEHVVHRHHISVFLGITDGGGESEDGHHDAAQHAEEIDVLDDQVFTVGLDYEYRLTKRWGVGALIDYAGGDHRSWVVGIPVTLHPGDLLKLLVAPGFEDRPGHDPEFLVRLGAVLDFEVGQMTVSPAINVDLVDGEEILVYGVNIGKGF